MIFNTTEVPPQILPSPSSPLSSQISRNFCSRLTTLPLNHFYPPMWSGSTGDWRKALLGLGRFFSAQLIWHYARCLSLPPLFNTASSEAILAPTRGLLGCFFPQEPFLCLTCCHIPHKPALVALRLRWMVPGELHSWLREGGPTPIEQGLASTARMQSWLFAVIKEEKGEACIAAAGKVRWGPSTWQFPISQCLWLSFMQFPLLYSFTAWDSSHVVNCSQKQFWHNPWVPVLLPKASLNMIKRNNVYLIPGYSCHLFFCLSFLPYLKF